MEKECLVKRARERDRGRAVRGRKRRGGGWVNPLAGCNRLQAVPGPQFAGNLASTMQHPQISLTHVYTHIKCL